MLPTMFNINNVLTNAGIKKEPKSNAGPLDEEPIEFDFMGIAKIERSPDHVSPNVISDGIDEVSLSATYNFCGLPDVLLS